MQQHSVCVSAVRIDCKIDDLVCFPTVFYTFYKWVVESRTMSVAIVMASSVPSNRYCPSVVCSTTIPKSVFTVVSMFVILFGGSCVWIFVFEGFDK